jgi:hypothetical protein
VVGRESLKLLVESPSILSVLLEVSPGAIPALARALNVVKALRRFGKATCLDGGSMLAREMLQAFEQDDCLPRDTLKIVWAMDKDERQLVQNK